MTDIRLLNCADIPQLHHLQDVIVFPVQGDRYLKLLCAILLRMSTRPHTNEIGGGDMDGDQYFVSWNEELIKIKQCTPGDFPAFTGGKKIPDDPEELERALMECLIGQIFSSSLGHIANLHECIIDKYDIFHPMALRLADCYVRALDAPKSGEIV